MPAGQVLPTYTPFATQAMGRAGDIFKARREKRVNQLAQNAYMGDPAALQELAAEDPQMAIKMEEQAAARKSRARQADLHEQAMEAKRRKFAMENRELMTDLGAQIGAFDDFETAKGYADEQFSQLEQIMGEGNVPLQELTPEVYEQYRQLHDVVVGDDWERSGGPVLEEINGQPTYVQKFVNPKTQEVRSVPTSTERALTAHDAQLRGEIKRSETRETTKEERLQTSIDKGLTSAEGVADLKRANELLTQVETGGMKAHASGIAQYFGLDADWTGNMGELRVLLAQDLIDKFSLMTGVLSETDMQLLRSIAAGTERSSVVNQRLLDRLIKRSERNVLRALDDAREGGRPSEVRELERAARDLGLSEYAIQTGDTSPPPKQTQSATAGASRDNPLVFEEGMGRPPSGTWVQKPDGSIGRVP